VGVLDFLDVLQVAIALSSRIVVQVLDGSGLEGVRRRVEPIVNSIRRVSAETTDESERDLPMLDVSQRPDINVVERYDEPPVLDVEEVPLGVHSRRRQRRSRARGVINVLHRHEPQNIPRSVAFHRQ
jgi:hypothetical protein